MQVALDRFSSLPTVPETTPGEDASKRQCIMTGYSKGGASSTEAGSHQVSAATSLRDLPPPPTEMPDLNPSDSETIRLFRVNIVSHGAKRQVLTVAGADWWIS